MRNMTTFNEADVVRDSSGKFDEKVLSAPEVQLGVATVTPEERYNAAQENFYGSALDELREAKKKAQAAQLELVRAEILAQNPNIVEAHYDWDDENDCMTSPTHGVDSDGNEVELDIDNQLDLFDDWDEARKVHFKRTDVDTLVVPIS